MSPAHRGRPVPARALGPPDASATDFPRPKKRDRAASGVMPGEEPFPSMTAPYPGPLRSRLAGRGILAPVVLAAAFTLFARAASAQSTDGPDVIAVFSSVSPDYA